MGPEMTGMPELQITCLEKIKTRVNKVAKQSFNHDSSWRNITNKSSLFAKLNKTNKNDYLTPNYWSKMTANKALKW